MLPKTYIEPLQVLAKGLDALVAMLEGEGEPADLLRQLQVLQATFQSQLLPLSPTDLPGELSGAWQALQTEVHRNLRLLQTETILLQAARQIPTQQQRREQVRSRLESARSQVRSLLEA